MLENIIEKIESIPTVEILRFHTRMPIVLPERMTAAFVSLLEKTRLHTVCVVHCNHPNELDNTIRDNLVALRTAGTHVLNQTVLLKGVNDDADTLCRLSYRLLDMGILPYYLHLLDKVQGAAHFDMSLEKATSIFGELQSLLPGYLVPRLVREEPGKRNKTLII